MREAWSALGGELSDLDRVKVEGDPAGLLPARFTVIELMGPDLSIVPGSGFSVEVVRPPGQLGSWRPQSEHTTELGVDQPISDSQGVR